MQSTILKIIIPTFLLSCTKNHIIQLPASDMFDVIEFLESRDSVDCWVVQFESMKNMTTQKFDMGFNIVHFGTYFATPDSIYPFLYPCEYQKSKAYRIHGNQLFVDHQIPKKFYFKKDSLELTYEKSYALNSERDSTKYLMIETYLRQKISSSTLLNLIKVGRDTFCDSSGYFNNISYFEYERYDNLIDGLDR